MKTMRSDLVFDALHTMRNRYMLCQLASKATRRFHRPNTRIQETMNEVLKKIAVTPSEDVMRIPKNLPRRRSGLPNQRFSKRASYPHWRASRVI